MHRRVRDASRLVRVIVDIVDIVEERRGIDTRRNYAFDYVVRFCLTILTLIKRSNQGTLYYDSSKFAR